MMIIPDSLFRLLPFLMLLLAPACQKEAEVPAGGKGGRGGGGNAKVPVLVTEAQVKTMPIILKTIGTVRANVSVSLKPQLSGQIAKVHFAEGQDVKAGDLLFTIDPRPAQIALAQSKADVEQAKVKVREAETRSQSYARLDRSGAVAKVDVSSNEADAASARIAVQAAEAAVQAAQLNLDYCAIKAPHNGRTGAVLVDAGNIVQANTTALVLINEVTPIEVTFSLAEQFLSEVTNYMKQGKLKVIATPEGKDARGAEGEVFFLSNEVNRAAGTIELKARFTNEDRVLWPGQFVAVDVQLANEPNRIVIPAKAVQTGQDMQFVYVVKDDLTAQMQPVVLNRTVKDEAVIAEGLQGREKIVIDGQGQLSPNAKVEIKTSLETAVAEKPRGEGQKGTPAPNGEGSKPAAPHPKEGRKPAAAAPVDSPAPPRDTAGK